MKNFIVIVIAELGKLSYSNNVTIFYENIAFIDNVKIEVDNFLGNLQTLEDIAKVMLDNLNDMSSQNKDS